MGTSDALTVPAEDPSSCDGMKKAPFPGPSVERMKRLELSTFCMASRRSSQLSYIRLSGPV
jgi:hypothetical protein